MKLNTLKLKKLLRQVDLEMFVWEELEDSESSISRFCESFFLNFSLKNLKAEKRGLFLNLLEELDDNKIEEKVVWDFLESEITDFEKRLAVELAQSLCRLKEKAIVQS